jgi:geranylgeranyl diphosphate synthase type II
VTTTLDRPNPEQKGRPGTAHLKAIPESRALRERIRATAAARSAHLDRSRPLTRERLRELGEDLLRELGLGEQYLGFAMVAVSNEFWREQVQAVAFSRRLLLLPHCLKHAEGCPADYDEFGLNCRKCGACSIASFKVRAEELGYKVLVSEGTPIVLKIIVSGHVDAIIGVACLNVLEKALDKVLLAGVPCLAVPLLSSNCRSTSVDEDWVQELIALQTPPPAASTRSYVHLLRAAHQICEEPGLSRLAPRLRARAPAPGVPTAPESPPADPLAEHEAIAYDWLARGGKRSRPFITLAAYDALRGAPGTRSPETLDLPDAVQRVALAIEAFHKASLVHDDIEDDDLYRYGQETLHRRWGLSTALNVGDYLIGLGYRLVSRERQQLGAACVADILDRLAEAHLKLSEGQGAELLWRRAADKRLTPLEALKIYALKTAPAFEAALYAGLRLAGAAERYEKMVVEFSRHLGIAFQILNDLKDWQGDEDNKLLAGQDALSGRPTLLLALALEGLSTAARQELLDLMQTAGGEPLAPRRHGENGRPRSLAPAAGERLRQLFLQAGAFAKAEKLVEKYRARAEAVADEVEPTELRELLYYLVDSVLEPPPPVAEEPPLLSLGVS